MGRKTTNPVTKMFFKYNINTNESICTIPECVNPVRSGNHAGNLENHVKTFHKNEYILLLNEKEKNAMKLKHNESVCSTSTVAKKQKIGPLDKMVIVTKNKLNNVSLNKTIIIDACVELIANNGRPLTLLDDSGFRKIMNPIMDSLGGGFKVNSRNIIQYIKEHSEEIIKTIKVNVHQRLISLKVDCATRLNRSILGVNVQYMKDGVLHISTLGMTELEQRHTSEYLKKILMNILKKYNIDKRQIYSITCDNGANIVKMVNIFHDDDETLSEIFEIDEENAENTDENFDFQDNNELLSATEVQNMITHSEIDFTPENLEQEISILLENETQFQLTQCVRCTVHTFQLCVEYGLKTPSVQKVLIKARKIVKVLRTQSYAALLKKENLKQSVIDMVTRWSSTYFMLMRLNEHKIFCKDHELINSELFLNIHDWDKINCLIKSLEPAYLATKMLQRKDITLGDFYGIWVKTKSKFIQINSVICNSIVSNMNIREQKLMDNSIFLSAIYLDPRYMCTLSYTLKIKAIDHLLKTWTLKELLLVNIDDTNNSVLSLNESLVDEPDQITNNYEENEDEFEKFLKSCSQTSTQKEIIDLNSSSSSTSSPLQWLKIKLEEYGKIERLPYKEDVAKFWADHKIEMPELYELAQIVMAVPATQVSVERSFSGLKFILSDLRNSISSDLLENILIIRGNKL